MPSVPSRTHDVVIVGARAAGASTALLLARLGHDVAVLDRAEFPSDTVSTHQIARPGVVALRRWGMLDTVLASGAPALRRVRFTSDLGSTVVTIKERAGVDLLVAPRRYILDTLLVDAATHAGATVHTGVSVRGVIRDATGRASGVRGHDQDGNPIELRARVVVGADGLHSRVARSVGAPMVVDRGAPGATLYAYYAGLPWPELEFVTRTGSYAGVFPTHHGEAAIWVCAPSTTVAQSRRGLSAEEGFEALLRHCAPQLAERLRDAERTSPARGMLHAPNQVRQGVGPGWALVGDAACHRDPVTGHGLTDAFRDAESLAVALDLTLRGMADEHQALATYERDRRAALTDVFDLTCQLAAYPPAAEFTELTKRLGAAFDAEADAIAVRPVPGPALSRA